VAKLDAHASQHVASPAAFKAKSTEAQLEAASAHATNSWAHSPCCNGSGLPHSCWMRLLGRTLYTFHII
jgi:hypothetical protein